MINIATDNLVPQEFPLTNGNTLYGFKSEAIELVKIDFSFEAGSVYQSKYLCSAAAISLMGEGTEKHSAKEIAEFMDFRGIVIERNPDLTTPSITFYSLRKFFHELLPWIREILCESVFPQEEFDVYIHKRRRQLMAQFKKTKAVAMTTAYESIFGPDHQLGMYAMPEHCDQLRVEDVREFYKQHFDIGNAHIMVSGNFDVVDVELIDLYFGRKMHTRVNPFSLKLDTPRPVQDLRVPLEGSVQSSIRIGRVLPMGWDSMEYSKFLILTTLLGGYMGSRLMSSVREEKGYTYGISSQTHIYRDVTVFFITTDVGGQYTQPAVDEIFHQIEILQNELVDEEELRLVCSVMEGDFIRSVDGIFERGERYRQMYSTGVTEKFRENYFEALETISPDEIMRLARTYLKKEDLTTVVVGVV